VAESVSGHLQDVKSRRRQTSQSSSSFDKTRFKPLLSWTKQCESRGLVTELKDVEYMVSVFPGAPDSLPPEHQHLGIFYPGSGPTDAQVDREREEAGKEGKRAKAVDLGVFEGDLMEVFAEAVKSGTVTEQMIALAPMHSWRVWAQLSEAYAAQCLSQGKWRQASVALVSVGKVVEAIR
jgi:hypothetical protein